ncbi:MAG TPA: hypothetical protein VFP97_14025 [Chitinophagaceae bacterium]|nr:hypothetical protein [Chitinophagaceae bacterium]
MANHHFERWIYKTVLGFLLVSGAIFFMYYVLTHVGRDNWILFGLISSLGGGIGAYLLSSAAVNKVKSDLIKRQKIKQQAG